MRTINEEKKKKNVKRLKLKEGHLKGREEKQVETIPTTTATVSLLHLHYLPLSQQPLMCVLQ